MAPDAPPLAVQAVDVVPLGDVPLEVTDAIVRRLSRYVAVRCTRRAPLPSGVVPRLAHRPQLDADAVLELLDTHPAPEGTAMLGLTTEDLGHPLFTFFFGRARIGGSAVVSLHRLDPAYYGLPPDADQTLVRATRECLHELGHVAGLQHCDDYRCVMHFSGDVESIDLRGAGWCAPCSGSLALPIHHARGA